MSIALLHVIVTIISYDFPAAEMLFKAHHPSTENKGLVGFESRTEPELSPTRDSHPTSALASFPGPHAERGSGPGDTWQNSRMCTVNITS